MPPGVGVERCGNVDRFAIRVGADGWRRRGADNRREQLRRGAESGFAVVQCAGEQRQRQRAFDVRHAERRERRGAALDGQVEPAGSALAGHRNGRQQAGQPGRGETPSHRESVYRSCQRVGAVSRGGQGDLGGGDSSQTALTGQRLGCASRGVASKSCMLRRCPPGSQPPPARAGPCRASNIARSASLSIST